MSTGITVPSFPHHETARSTGTDLCGLSPDELMTHIHRCGMNDRESQKRIYAAFYGFSMAICNRFSNSYEDAIEIVNDGFLKIFKESYRFEPAYSDVIGSFRGWVRKIMQYSSIDHFRRNKKFRFSVEINSGAIQLADESEDALDKISHREIMSAVHELTPAYRAVLSLFIIEGWTHHEIAARLRISVGTSKSNLAKARIQLQKILLRKNETEVSKSQTAGVTNRVIDATNLMKKSQGPAFGSRA